MPQKLQFPGKPAEPRDITPRLAVERVIFGQFVRISGYVQNEAPDPPPRPRERPRPRR